MDIDEILLTAEDSMEKTETHLRNELRGIRTGRASTALLEYIKVDYYGSPTELRQIALISVPEPSQLMVKPFDASSTQAIAKGISAAGLGLNPITEKNQIRITIPALSGERRNQLVATIKQLGEQARITTRNARRDANKHVGQAAKDKTLSLSEDQVDDAKDEVQKLLKRYENRVNTIIDEKTKEVQEI